MHEVTCSEEHLSVIICTHNPREDYLSRVLQSLREQTLPTYCWELILIDNACPQLLSERWDLSWHPNGRCVREDELGLANARMRGIRESRGELIVFVDDDNVIESDYLEMLIKVSEQYSFIGAFGASIKGEFAIKPPDWIKPYLAGLAVHEISRDCWSNLPHSSDAVPVGAGMCVRRHVADNYVGKLQRDPRRKALGRAGSESGSGEDTDLALCAIDLGMGTARCCALKLTHLIPKERLTMDYITKLYAQFDVSSLVLGSIRGKPPLPFRRTWRDVAFLMIRWLLSTSLQRKILVASYRETARARVSLQVPAQKGVA